MFKTKIAEVPASLALLCLRLGAGLMMLPHGWKKFLKVGELKADFPDPFGWGSDISLYLTLLSELVFPVLIALGFLTRLAAIPLLVVMGVAIFSIHAGDPFSDKELAVFYFIAYLSILLAGPGKFSLDKLILKK